jgi:hypothetical protein
MVVEQIIEIGFSKVNMSENYLVSDMKKKFESQTDSKRKLGKI